MATKKTTTKPVSVLAVIEIGPRQYLIREGDMFAVDNQNTKDKTITTDKVLLTFDGQKTNVGQPYVKGAKVELEVLKTEKGEKIRVARYRAKSRYRRVKGSRALLTHLKVKAIKLS